jgi:hypothetical protein
MSLAPENHLRACLKAMSVSILRARFIAWEGERHPDPKTRERFHQVAELMDAIHNIPGLLIRWGTCDIDRLRASLGPLVHAYDQELGRDGDANA